MNRDAAAVGDPLCEDETPDGTFTNKIAIGKRGEIARLAKSFNVAQRGALLACRYQKLVRRVAVEHDALAGEKSPHARHRSQPARCPPRDPANASSPRPRKPCPAASAHRAPAKDPRTDPTDTRGPPADRLLWVWLARSWREWRQGLSLVKPETVVRWSRQRFRTYWARKSRRRSGRPAIDPDIRALIRKISRANPLWGTPRIDSELRKLGIKVSPTTVAKYRVGQRHPPSPTWRSFLRNHARDLVAADFFTVPTATFQVLFVCVILAHHRRRIVHLNVTANPTAAWTAQQVVEAFPEDTAPRYLLRDRDRIYGLAFRRRVDGLGIREVLTAARSPWQNPYAERVIGSIRRECLDHVIVLNEQHLRRVLRTYLGYYHRTRCHLALARDAPAGRAVQGPEQGTVIAIPEVGGLHHRYERRAA